MRSTIFGVDIARPAIFALGPRYNREVLGNPQTWRTARITQSGPRDSAQRRLGHNLVSLNGPTHAHYRKLLASPLRRPAIEEIGDEIGELIEQHISRWPTDAVVDLLPLTRRLVRALAVRLLFDGDEEWGETLGGMLDRHLYLSARLRTLALPLALPGMPYRRLLRDAEAIERLVLDFAASKAGRINPRDLMAIIVNAPDNTGRPPDGRAAAGHLPILFGASYETCATVLLWALFLVSQHPDVAVDLVDEVTGAIGRGGASVASATKLDLLDRVVKESMRLLPAVVYQLRVATDATSLDDRAITQGTRIVLSPYLTNRLPTIYAQAARFQPERWLQIKPSTFEYLTFSAGPRTCPGSWFGLSIVKVAVAAILSRFSIAVVPQTRIDRHIAITMTPRYGLPVVMRRPGAGWRTVPVTGQISEMVDFPSAE